MPKTEEKDSKEIGKLTPGDYTIHVLVQKTKDMAVPEGQTSNVMVQVECDRQKEFTKTFEN
jgi:hypothetical protein